MNERKTEQVVRKHFSQYPQLKVEEQKSDSARIQKLLKHASKSGKGIGKPEFLVQLTEDIILVVECKADVNKHQTEQLTQFKDYAVDGVLCYASYLSKSFNTIAIGVSGEHGEKVTTYLIRKGSNAPINLDINELSTPEEYIRQVRVDPQVKRATYEELTAFTAKLHNFLRDYAKLSESEKPLLIAGILIALYDPWFNDFYDDSKDGYRKVTGQRLANETYRAIKSVLESKHLPVDKIESMMFPFAFIKAHPELTKGDTLQQIVTMVDEQMTPFITTYKDVDILGQFYGEFLSYTAGDKKGLGIVLTPKHICELFTQLARVNQNSVVYDPCCGTGGFLIASMVKMLEQAEGKTEQVQSIKQNQLVGVEMQPHMYALAASNMLLRGDGQTSLFLGSCFDLTDKVKEHHPNVCLLNPPYSQKGKGLGELDFILHGLDCLEVGGTLVAIVPMSCCISHNKERAAILEKHTLEATMSMPTGLFPTVGTMTCVMVFKAHQPHDSTAPSWFSRWEDDGFRTLKHKGRQDPQNVWPERMTQWLDDYKHRRVVPGYSVSQCVTAQDEWLVHAYVETDYSHITPDYFLKEFIKLQIKGTDTGSVKESAADLILAARMSQ